MLRINLNRLLVTALSLCVFISCTNTPKAQQSIKGGSIPIAKDLATDSVLVNMYTPYKIGLDSIMEEILCYSPFFLEKSRPESELSNWMADVCYQKVTESHKADFCLLNYGGIRASLPKGAIKRKDIYQLMPFENELVVVELADTNFYRVLDYLKISGGHPISNIMLAINKDRITHNLDLNKTVRILTSDYLANGGDKMAFFKDSVSHTKTGLKIRDLLLLECKKIDTIQTTIDNRFTYD